MSAKIGRSSGSMHPKLHGLAWALAEIDPETLPETDPWPEVRRRVAAWREGRPGWRTGRVETTLGEFGGVE